MKKIPCLFVRDFTDPKNSILTTQVTPGCEWVINGEGVATRKFDGTACLIEDGKVYKRYDAKHGKPIPEGFIPCQPEADPVTGHHPGWLLITDKPEDKWHHEAFDENYKKYPERFPNGTYELCGPKINGNREGFDKHVLVKHGIVELHLKDMPLTFDNLKAAFGVFLDIEGIVWHHPDGRMCKLRLNDFGIKRPAF